MSHTSPSDLAANERFLQQVASMPVASPSASTDSKIYGTGVEENESSRFVDYSLSSSWEVLVNDCERGVKAVLGLGCDFIEASTTIEYNSNGIPFAYTLSFEDTNYSKTWSNLYKWFGVSKCLIMQNAEDMSYYFNPNNKASRNQNYKSLFKTIYSAVITAMQSLEVNVPIFLIDGPLENGVETMSTINGYQIYKMGRHIKSFGAIFNFESVSQATNFTKLTIVKHPLFYLDGVWDLFQQKIKNFIPNYVSDDDWDQKNTSIEVCEYYNHTMDRFHFSDIGGSLQRARGFVSDKSDWNSLLGLGKFLKHVLYCNKDAYLRKLAILQSFQVRIHYKGSRSNLIIDNASYTTMQAQRLPIEAWCIYANFNTFNNQKPDVPPPSPQSRSPRADSGKDIFHLTSSLQKLLAGYVISKSSDSYGISINNILSTALNVKLSGAFNAEKSQAIASVLPDEIKDIIAESCAYIAKYDNKIFDINQSDHKEFFDLLFENSKNIDPASMVIDPSLFKLISDKFDIDVRHPGVTSVGWLHLVSLYTSQLEGGILEVALFWLQCSQKLRDCWESGRGVGFVAPYNIETRQSSLSKGTRSVSVGSSDGKKVPNNPAAVGRNSSSSQKNSSNNGSSSNSSSSSSSSNNNNNNNTSSSSRSNSNDGSVNDGIISDNTSTGGGGRDRTKSVSKLGTGGPSKSFDGLYNEFRHLNLHGTDIKWLSPLWDDAIDLCHERDFDIALPNSKFPLALQKLQMLQFCCGVKDMSPTIDSPLSPPAGSTISKGGKERRKGSSEEESANNSTVQILRRSPLTDDSVAQYLHISNKISLGISKTNKESSPMVRWQILSPNLVSDVRAFKHGHPDKKLEDFLMWSCSYSKDAYDEVCGVKELLQEIWDSGDACSAALQKPLFRVVTEAEKCLSYFDNMTPVQVYADLLIGALQAAVVILLSELVPIVTSVMAPANIDRAGEKAGSYRGDEQEVEIARGLLLQANLLVEQVEELVIEIYIDTKTEDLSLGATQHTLLNISDALQSVQKLEQFLLRYKAMSNILNIKGVDENGIKSDLGAQRDDLASEKNSIRRLAVLTAGQASAVCVTEHETKLLYHLAKKSSTSDNSSFYQAGNRDLVPHEKSFVLSRNIHIEDALNDLLKGTYLSREDLMSHRICVDIHPSRIRVSNKFTELDL